jgi:hypothetical protein
LMLEPVTSFTWPIVAGIYVSPVKNRACPDIDTDPRRIINQCAREIQSTAASGKKFTGPTRRFHRAAHGFSWATKGLCRCAPRADLRPDLR